MVFLKIWPKLNGGNVRPARFGPARQEMALGRLEARVVPCWHGLISRRPGRHDIWPMWHVVQEHGLARPVRPNYHGSNGWKSCPCMYKCPHRTLHHHFANVRTPLPLATPHSSTPIVTLTLPLRRYHCHCSATGSGLAASLLCLAGRRTAPPL
jgi:hypothetical protein